MLPEVLIKVDREQDYYVVWSWDEDRPVRWGGRRELETGTILASHMASADATGAATIWPPTQGPHSESVLLPWDDNDGMPVGDLGGALRREDMRAAIARLEDDPDDDLTDFLSWPNDEEWED